MSNAWSKGTVSFVCLKMSKQMKREKKMQLTVFLFCCKDQVDSVYFRFIDITRTKQYTCETDDNLITRMELFLYCIDNANIMTQQRLLETCMKTNSVIHQPNV